MASSLGIHDAARWQFWSRIHVPLSIAEFIAFSAMGPCPCPREIACNFLFIFISIASFSRSSYGSEPGEMTNTIGMMLDASLYEMPRLKGGGSMKRCPM
eukprot:scaffold16068_cov113-Isochrysis_galbana.AAC.2